jgi:hypothetical protein
MAIAMYLELFSPAPEDCCASEQGPVSDLGRDYQAKPVPAEANGLVPDFDPTAARFSTMPTTAEGSPVHHHDQRITSGELLTYRMGCSRHEATILV